MPARRFRVFGRVQGVGYRRFVVGAAGALGLRGTVTNCPDGSVEVVAAGPAAGLDLLRDRLRIGPRFANVTNVDVIEISEEAIHATRFSVDA